MLPGEISVGGLCAAAECLMLSGKIDRGGEVSRPVPIRLSCNGCHYRLDHVTTNDMRRRAGLIAGRHRHPVFHLIYITEGRGGFIVNGVHSRAEPGMLYVINPGEWHEFSGDEDAPMSDLECTFLLLDDGGVPAEAHLFDFPKLASLGAEALRELRHKPFRVPRPIRPYLADGFRRILEAPAGFYSQAHLEVLVADLFLCAEEAALQASGLRGREVETTDSAVAARLKTFMNAGLAADITLADLAAEVHLTPNYLCRVFKEQTGESPMGYLTRRRMEEAAKLLAHTDLPVYLIAEKVGYADPSYFARAFRRYAGLPPQAYRSRSFG